MVVANKVDLKRADLEKVKAAFPQYDVIGTSAKYGNNINDVYEGLFKLVR